MKIRRHTPPPPPAPAIHGAIIAADSFVAWITRLGGLAAGLSLLAYLTGWRQAAGYYSAIGAKWALDLTEPVSLIRMAAPHFFTMAVPALLSVMQIMQGKTAVDFRRHAIWAVLISMVLMQASTLASFGVPIPPWIVSILLTASVYVFYLCMGYTVGEIIALSYENRYAWSSQIVWLIYFMFAFGFYNVPWLYGTAHGEGERAEFFKTHPTVSTLGAAPGEMWKAIAVLGDRFLLVRVDAGIYPMTFKLIRVDLAQVVHSQ